MFKQNRNTSKCIWQREDLNFSHEHFTEKYWLDNALTIGSAQGRGTTWFVKYKQHELALRHYYRGGFFGYLVKDNYLFLSWEKTRAFQELEILRHLHDCQVNAPKPFAARVVKSSPFTYRADILTQKVTNAEDLASILKKRSISSQLYKKIGQEVAKMHNARVNHTDLNIHNILIDNNKKIWIIDFDKCHISKKGVWKEANLERLKRSFKKEHLRYGAQWNESDWSNFMQGYNKD
ncbi:3-deoxy-D-manno-octulosonic acid kinase [Vibrio crassostreae 9CS106]|nr:3-deoxy-D-manno-octulosonic acid kinase [Vibrio crassostreae 9CS106]